MVIKLFYNICWFIVTIKSLKNIYHKENNKHEFALWFFIKCIKLNIGIIRNKILILFRICLAYIYSSLGTASKQW